MDLRTFYTQSLLLAGRTNSTAKTKPTKRYYHEGLGLILINFLRALYNNRLNLDINKFSTHKEVNAFLRNFNKEITFSDSYLSKIKNRGLEYHKVPMSPQCQKFIEYVKLTFPQFDEKEFVQPLITSYGEASDETIITTNKKPEINLRIENPEIELKTEKEPRNIMDRQQFKSIISNINQMLTLTTKLLAKLFTLATITFIIIQLAYLLINFSEEYDILQSKLQPKDWEKDVLNYAKNFQQNYENSLYNFENEWLNNKSTQEKPTKTEFFNLEGKCSINGGENYNLRTHKLIKNYWGMLDFNKDPSHLFRSPKTQFYNSKPPKGHKVSDKIHEHITKKFWSSSTPYKDTNGNYQSFASSLYTEKTTSGKPYEKRRSTELLLKAINNSIQESTRQTDELTFVTGGPGFTDQEPTVPKRNTEKNQNSIQPLPTLNIPASPSTQKLSYEVTSPAVSICSPSDVIAYYIKSPIVKFASPTTEILNLYSNLIASPDKINKVEQAQHNITINVIPPSEASTDSNSSSPTFEDYFYYEAPVAEGSKSQTKITTKPLREPNEDDLQLMKCISFNKD